MEHHGMEFRWPQMEKKTEQKKRNAARGIRYVCWPKASSHAPCCLRLAPFPSPPTATHSSSVNTIADFFLHSIFLVDVRRDKIIFQSSKVIIRNSTRRTSHVISSWSTSKFVKFACSVRKSIKNATRRSDQRATWVEIRGGFLSATDANCQSFAKVSSSRKLVLNFQNIIAASSKYNFHEYTHMVFVWLRCTQVTSVLETRLLSYSLSSNNT